MARMPVKTEVENSDGSFDKVDMYPEAKCSICGSDHTAAMWRGSEEVFICLNCAVNILPRLIAKVICFNCGSRNEVAPRNYLTNCKI
jgi:hypothetical protein